MSRNPNRVLCRCRQGKVSMWDGKCGHCRDADHPRKAFIASLPVPYKTKEPTHD